MNNTTENKYYRKVAYNSNSISLGKNGISLNSEIKCKHKRVGKKSFYIYMYVCKNIYKQCKARWKNSKINK